YPQTNRKIDTGKTLTRWPVFVDHFRRLVLNQSLALNAAQTAVVAITMLAIMLPQSVVLLILSYPENSIS
ncbi:hypothetical protein, partial [Shigella flexneri]|uniref:hypothetical protein n=1 Tax=Shigella flexneri TaxID=623 RepID=UPI003CF051A5